MTTRPTPVRLSRWRLAVVVITVAGLIGFTSVWTNTLGAADRLDRLVARVELILDPPPDRPTLPTVVVTPRPSAAATSEPKLEATPWPELAGPGELVPPDPTPIPPPAPIRAPVDVTIVGDQAAHQAVFISQQTTEWCAVAGTQMVLAILGLGDTSPEFQHEIAGRIGEWESWEDSHDGGWGPAAIAEALADYGGPRYEVRAYVTMEDALVGAATALSTTGKPVVLLPWWGAHTWVMTGYRADADPTVFADATVTGLYILDPWYPRFSNIWGQSDPPGNFEDLAEMRRNYPSGTARDGWTRLEGPYPDRDGMFIVVVPTY